MAIRNFVSLGVLSLYLTDRGVLRRRRIKMQSAYLQFKHPNILRTSDELSPPNFFLGSRMSECLPLLCSRWRSLHGWMFLCSGLDPRKKFDGESSSEVRKMLGCLNCKYADCIFIRRRLLLFLQQDCNHWIVFKYSNTTFYSHAECSILQV